MTASRTALWVLLVAVHATVAEAVRGTFSGALAALQGDDASAIASPGEITQKWCDKDRLRDMHGEDSGNLEKSEMEELEDKVVGAIKHELERNNVDAMANDIFSFYVCVRWAPDKAFWDLAKTELPSMVEDSIRELMTHTDTDYYQNEPTDDAAKMLAAAEKKAELEKATRQGEALAIAEMYRTYRFVPMLCSQSLEVYGHKNDDGLHFPLFEQQVESLADFITTKKNSTTYSNLTALDRSFCKSGIMTACDRFAFFDKVMSSPGEDPAKTLQEFGDSTSEDFKAWKVRFPYHSFVTKAPDYKADKKYAPVAEQRFVVCFGKRVASDLHRRKNGQHILTDQNNIGCHGWYDHGETTDQLQRIKNLWKPPTCQLATMTYTMKKELMQKFATMNEVLFAALPSMINDEIQDQDQPSSHVEGFVSGASHVATSAYKMVAGIFPRRQRGIADLMSGSVSKWVVCPIREDAGDHAELNRQLGQEDPAFQDFQQLGYRKWRPQKSYEPDTPGSKCERIAESDDKGQFPDGSVCKISELQENYVEAYREPHNKSADYEEFICPIRPPLPAGEQLKVLKEKGTCFLHMTGVQQEQHAWHYQGFFPARKQNEKKSNHPRVEFELVKLTDVGGDEIKSEASFARYCTIEELTSKNGQRFCELPKVHNDPGTMENVVNMFSEALHGVMDGDSAASMGNVGMTIVENTLQAQKEMAATRTPESGEHVVQSGQEQSSWKNKTKDAGMWASQATWEQIRGAGRFIASSSQYAASMQQFIGEGRMAQELHDSIFANAQAGPLLHALSFQASSGKKGVNENENEAFERYVLSYPCPKFEPGTFFTTKSTWRKVVVRGVVEAHNAFDDLKSDGTRQSVLDFGTLNLNMRGEGLLYKNSRSHTTTVFKKARASMMWEEASEAAGRSETLECKWDGHACAPQRWCTETWRGWLTRNSSDRCRERHGSKHQHGVDSRGWWKIGDRQLARKFAPMLTTGSFDFDDLKGVRMTLWCGKKEEFGPTGAPARGQTTSLLDCMVKGMAENQVLQAKEPWRLYFPEETVVVAQFTQIEADLGRCLVSEKASGDAEYSDEVAQVCKGVQKVAPDDQDFEHIVDKEKSVPWGKDPGSDDVFVGARLGFGFPAATLSEVVLKPQDILDAIGAIPASHAA